MCDSCKSTFFPPACLPRISSLMLGSWRSLMQDRTGLGWQEAEACITQDEARPSCRGQEQEHVPASPRQPTAPRSHCQEGEAVKTLFLLSSAFIRDTQVLCVLVSQTSGRGGLRSCHLVCSFSSRIFLKEKEFNLIHVHVILLYFLFVLSYKVNW